MFVPFPGYDCDGIKVKEKPILPEGNATSWKFSFFQAKVEDDTQPQEGEHRKINRRYQWYRSINTSEEVTNDLPSHTSVPYASANNKKSKLYWVEDPVAQILRDSHSRWHVCSSVHLTQVLLLCNHVMIFVVTARRSQSLMNTTSAIHWYCQ